VHIGDFLARLYEFGSGGDDNVSYLDPQALKLLKIKFSQIEKITDELMDKLVEMSGFSFS